MSASTEVVYLPVRRGPSEEDAAAAERLLRLYPELDAGAALRLIQKGMVRA